MTKIICHNCQHFYITYKNKFPYGCKAFGVISKKIPYLEVKNISGINCALFSKRIKMLVLIQKRKTCVNQQINAMQESIKIALDAADAATDVTSEYKRIKNEYIKAEQKVKEIHKYTTIVFSSSIATAVIAIILTGLLYFKSLSELDEMTGTSKEALVVFAENVENVNKAVEDMNASLAKHSDLVNANQQIQNALDELSVAIKDNDKNLMINLSKEVSNLSNIVSKSIKEESSKLGKSISENNVLTSAKLNKEFEKLMNENKKTQNTKLLKELSNSTSSLNAALEAISSQNKLLVKEIKGQKKILLFHKSCQKKCK